MGSPETATSTGPLLGAEALPTLFEFLTVEDRLVLALVATGASPTGSFILGRASLATALAEEIAPLGVVTHATPEITLGNLKYTLLSVARSEADAQEVASLCTNPTTDHARYGQLSGFPETAITAYVNEAVIGEADLPPEIREHPYFPEMLFFMSRDHFTQEWAAYVESIKRIGTDFPDLASQLELTEYIQQGIDFEGQRGA